MSVRPGLKVGRFLFHAIAPSIGHCASSLSESLHSLSSKQWVSKVAMTITADVALSLSRERGKRERREERREERRKERGRERERERSER